MTLKLSYPSDLVFACASYAARVNGGYCKIPEYAQFNHETGTGGELTKQTNKTVLLEALENQALLTEADWEHSRLTRQFCQGLIMRQLAHGNLSDFHQKMMEYAGEEEVRVGAAGVIAYAPIFASQQITRQTVAERLDSTTKEHIGKIGEKITLKCEVIRSTYSQQYGCYFITAITEDNKAIYFAFKRALDVNQKYSLEGKVKDHPGNYQTKLNYVKI